MPTSASTGHDPPVARDQKYRRRNVTVPVAVSTANERSPLLRADGRPLTAGSGGGKSGRLGRRISIYFRLEGQLQPFTSHGQRRISEGHLARIDPVPIRGFFQRFEGHGKLLSKPFFHLIHEYFVIPGQASCSGAW